MSGPPRHPRGSALRASGRLLSIGGLAAATLVRAARTGGGSRAELRRARARLLSGAVSRALAVHGLEVEVTGPRPEGPALLVSNHLSYLDPLVIAARAPCVPISKAELASWPLFGAVARRTGVLFVERSSAPSRLAVMGAVEQVLEDGALALNFPEGTTTDGGTVLPFRRGLFGVARRLGIPIIPAALAYDPPALAWTGDATFVPHYLRFAALPHARVRLAFGEPIPSRQYESAQALAEAAHARTCALLFPRPRQERPDAWLRMTR